MMEIEKIVVESNTIGFKIFNVGKYVPYIFKRITIDNYKYFDARIPLLGKTDEWFVGNIEELLPYLYEEKPIRCDLVGFREENESVEGIQCKDDFALQEYTINVENGEMIFQVYKNAAKGISFFVKFVPKWRISMFHIAQGDESVAFQVVANFDKPFSLYLMRRANTEHDYSYDCEIEMENDVVKKGDYIFTVFFRDLLKGYCNNCNEIWDFVAKVDGKMFPVFADEKKYASPYFDINDDFKARFFVSEKKYGSLYTKEGTNGLQRKIKVAIMGSCYTKEAFHSIAHTNPTYKRIYENNLMSFHQSIIAMMSKPIPFKKQELKGHSQDLIDKYAAQMFNKTFLNDLRSYNADYLIIDNYIESAALLFEVSDTQYITESFFLADTEALKRLKTTHKYGISNEKRFALYQKAVDNFSKEIRKIMPESHIIIVRAWPATQKIEDGIVSNWNEIDWIRYVRKLWERNDNYLIKKLPKARVIDMRSNKYKSVRSTELSFNINHLQSEYYRELMGKINELVLQNIIKGNGVI